MAIVAEAAERQGHHPDVDWRWNTIFLRTTSHDMGGEITERDIELATLLEFAAADSGAIAVPHRHQDLTLAIDTQDPTALEGFWAASMGYRKGRDGDLVDPERRNPPIWFQQTDTPNENRIHIDRLVARSEFTVAREKMEPATGPGDDSFAPRWVVYTDPDGNRMCLCAEPEVPGLRQWTCRSWARWTPGQFQRMSGADGYEGFNGSSLTTGGAGPAPQCGPGAPLG